MRTISLTQGRIAIVDDADYEFLSQWKWHATVITARNHTSYAVRNSSQTSGFKRLKIFMHQVILGLQQDDKRECDHRDGNGLNNQRSNLRACTTMQNHQSSRKRKIGTSKYKGVYRNHRDRNWCSRIRINKKLTSLGSFDLEVDAAKSYDRAALKHFGQFALTNETTGLV